MAVVAPQICPVPGDDLSGGSTRSQPRACCASISELDLSENTLGKKAALFASFCIKMIMLPRQARDKHRNMLRKKAAFLVCREGWGELAADGRA
jgi:hypothetical protein